MYRAHVWAPSTQKCYILTVINPDLLKGLLSQDIIAVIFFYSFHYCERCFDEIPGEAVNLGDDPTLMQRLDAGCLILLHMVELKQFCWTSSNLLKVTVQEVYFKGSWFFICSVWKQQTHYQLLYLLQF